MFGPSEATSCGGSGSEELGAGVIRHYITRLRLFTCLIVNQFVICSAAFKRTVDVCVCGGLRDSVPGVSGPRCPVVVTEPWLLFVSARG